MPHDNLSGVIPGFDRPPEICVDYLSHQWKEDDIWMSWKAMSKKKKDIANGVRLENASWRTWAKQKNNLNTVNPEKLNWLKDSDVTWLYGPLHTSQSGETHDGANAKMLTTEDKFNLMGASHKSCLKKRSISDILRPVLNGRHPILASTSNSDTQLYKDLKDDDFCSSRSSTSISTMSSATTDRPEQHIRFNDQVEQCIAVESEDDNVFDDETSSSSDDGGLEMKSSQSRKTICKLAPTKLKAERVTNNEYSALYRGGRRSPSVRTSGARKSSAGTRTQTAGATATVVAEDVTKTTTTTTTATTTTTTTTAMGTTTAAGFASGEPEMIIPTPASSPATPTISSSRYSGRHSCYSWNDDLDVEDLMDIGVFTGFFDDYEQPSNSRSSPSVSSMSDHLSRSIILDDSTGEDGEGDDDDLDAGGIVDRAVQVATNVRDIVHWCSSMVFNGHVF